MVKDIKGKHSNNDKKVNKSLSDVLKNKGNGKKVIGKGSGSQDKGKQKSNNNKSNNNNDEGKKRKFKTVHGKRVDDKPNTFKSLKERKPNYGLVESMKDKVNLNYYIFKKIILLFII